MEKDYWNSSVISFLNELDVKFFVFLNQLNAKELNSVMVFFSGKLIWIPFILFFLFENRKNKDRTHHFIFVFFLFLTVIASDVTSSYIIKNLAQRLRPCRVDLINQLIYQFGQKCGGKFGFVSSHAANSLAIVLFSFKALQLKHRWNLLLFLLPLMVSYSRIYLGVHYPGDILGGFFVGIFWSLFFATLYRKITEQA